MPTLSTPPTMMPAMPPARLIITASLRNCASTSLCVAPTARRTPISLMRSRIDASMMFMIPIPPTIERDRRDRAEHDVEDRLRVLLLLQQQLGHA